MPRISVLMPLYGHADFALAALDSMVANTPTCYEVIIVDNASPDGAGDVVAAQVSGARLIRNPLNVGFGAAVNQAALHARGELLLLLNSDVEVQPGWLPPLLEVLDRRQSVAAVSPALLHADGTLAEVGSVLLSDGETMSLVDDHEWELSRPRAVPYASAACMLIRRSVFSAIGGFDAAYVRGYYEDVELALDLRARGLLVVSDPRSRVRHSRSGSSSPERAIALNRFNRTIFRERWASTLAALPPYLHETTLRGRDSFAVDRVLVVDDRIAQSDRGSGDPRMASLLTSMATRYPSAVITLLASDLSHAERYAPSLSANGVEIADWSSSSPQRWLASRRGHFSAVVVSRAQNVERFGDVILATQPQAIRVVDVEAVVAVRLSRQAQLLEALGDTRARVLEAEATESMKAEVAAWRWADVITCVSAEEADLVRSAAPGREVVLMSWGVELPDRPVGHGDRHDAVFLGGFMSGDDSPNADAVRHLVDDLMPELWAVLPELRLTIAGSDPTPSVLARGGGRVSVVGRVADPVDTIERHLVQLVPLRFGSGVKLKLIESIISGSPFVTTTVGAEGLHLGALTEMLVGDSAAAWCRRAVHLLTDAVAWQEAHEELLAIGRAYFGLAAFDRSVDELMGRLGALRP
ncbi:MAG: glycosyltransferase [Actinomycetota bacterium]|nr:glycosyltransferase [Actinomycetota bacterium]